MCAIAREGSAWHVQTTQGLIIAGRVVNATGPWAARIGQISQNFSDALFTAEIPKNVRTGEFADEKVEAFCDKMTEVAEPLEARSLEAYGVCLSKSTELGWFSDWSKLCERELGQIKPEEYPTASELHADPGEVAPVTDLEQAPTKIE